MVRMSKYTNRLTNIGLIILVCISLYTGYLAFCSTYFVTWTETPSMSPTVMPFDRVLVHRNITPKNDDILLFTDPDPWRADSIIPHEEYPPFIKRCIAIGGDTFAIHNAHYYVNGKIVTSTPEAGLSHLEQVTATKRMAKINQIHLEAWPYDTLFNWTIRELGPVYIPQRGDTITINDSTAILYKSAIEWETRKGAYEYIGKEYTFKESYLYMAGDNVECSQDSRYWGLLPESLVKGRADFIFYSTETKEGDIRWERLFTIL